MITILLVIVGIAYAMPTFVPVWLKSAIFVDGVIFGVSYFFISSPQYCIGVVGLILLALVILAHIGITFFLIILVFLTMLIIIKYIY